MEAFITEFFIKLQSKWPSISGLFILFLIIFFALALFSTALINASKSITFLGLEITINISFLALLAVFWIIAWVYWLHARRVPRTNKGKIGMVIAIRTESKNEYRRLKTDLIDEINRTLNNGKMNSLFDVIPLSEFHSAQIYNRETAFQMLKRAKGHFIIYGYCKRRNDHEKDTYKISTEAVVIHREVPITAGSKLSREFAELHPRELKFPVENEMAGFELAREQMEITAKYIIGIAALLSGDYKLALNFFQELYDSNDIKKSNDVATKIRNRLPRRICDAAILCAQREYYIYRQTKEIENLNNLKPYLDLLKQYFPNSYYGHMLRGIYIFLVEKDVPNALKEINKAKNKDDVSWCYSEAFLYGYEGNLVRADKSYKKAFSKEVEKDTLYGVNEFIYDVLEREPEKFQLWYCIGLIEYRGFGNMKLAKDALENFIADDGSKKYPDQRLRAEKIVDKIISKTGKVNIEQPQD